MVVLALAGILLLIIAMPSGSEDEENAVSLAEETEENMERSADDFAEETVNGDEYTALLEKKLKAVLLQMEGVGDVEVMITVADTGESVVEKDTSDTTTTTVETDSAGGSHSVTESSREENTVYVESGDEKYPYIQNEKLPVIEGVVVVAEGGGSAVVVSDISDAVKALFSVEAYRIKVVKMCSKEE